MDFNNDQNEPQNQQNSNMNYQPKKGTFFKKKIVYGFFMFIVLLIILLTFRKEIFSSDDTNQNNKKIIKNEVSKEAKISDSDNTQYGEEDMQDLSYDERDENGGLTEEELNYPVQGNDEENIAEQKSSEEIERENRLKQLQAESDAAFRSPTTITIANRPQTQEVDNKLLLAKSQANPIQDYDGNRQESKKNFLMNEQAQKFYQTNFLVEQLSEFELKAGDFIPATLQTGINSDLPSKIIVAVVSENVRDTITGKHILIPQGTRVIGTYDSSVTFGQERLLVIWQRLIFPNGKSIGLDNMQGVDLSGKAGITGEIDNHFGTLLKGVVLSSIMGSTGAIVTDRKNDWRGAAAEGAGEQIVTIGDRFADRALSRQPTITIEPGTRLNIMVHSDLILEPYGE
ncbi:TrbI/VirB10 family protein [Fusobacterium nucleatum]|uniref:Bacterial conjugation TrbI-like protein n=1 Tax=Fusobacterium nucleatum TaxID=851 RepID=A0A133P6A9_FUSNU|nr:TrbI/VirB10 family protein [Fusobacterium nucleatum]KXA24040.1 bacterial conjugation TrbI-like protein [Fusobacterium nucleatum]MCL4576498.1 conjugal transfer protein TrbI [Fusobacterium nucleatum YWH7056]MCL4582083.1 conjugal transfer protein TrbI [Fusobacterium nucleatum YWH7054]MCL4591556.1 conjugal transfer protein TrbI [Fusobacterium nucleatum YWH7053]